MPSIDCSYGTCRSPATHRVKILIQSGRAAGENVLLWVCKDHSKEVGDIKKVSLIRRMKDLVTTV